MPGACGGMPGVRGEEVEILVSGDGEMAWWDVRWRGGVLLKGLGVDGGCDMLAKEHVSCKGANAFEEQHGFSPDNCRLSGFGNVKLCFLSTERMGGKIRGKGGYPLLPSACIFSIPVLSILIQPQVAIADGTIIGGRNLRQGLCCACKLACGLKSSMQCR